MKAFSSFISYLFHPLLMATYGCLFLFYGLQNTVYTVYTPQKLKLVITLIVFTFSFLLPVLSLYVFQRLRFISSLKLENRKERTFPYVVTAMYYFGLFYMIMDFSIWLAIKLFILGGGISILLTAIINHWWQISAHMTGIGGFLGAFFSIATFKSVPMLWPISIMFLLAGCVGTARLFLKVHSPAQVYSGFLLGFLAQMLLFYIAQSINFV